MACVYQALDFRTVVQFAECFASANSTDWLGRASLTSSIMYWARH